MIDRLVARFARWFASSGSVWQTTCIVLAWVGFELAFPRVDPHGFVVLYVLTVYSAITQPALAYAANVAAEEAQRATSAQELILRNELDSMRVLLALTERIEGLVEEIAQAHSGGDGDAAGR
jgi:uncharacterized membrane protein